METFMSTHFVRNVYYKKCDGINVYHIIEYLYNRIQILSYKS